MSDKPIIEIRPSMSLFLKDEDIQDLRLMLDDKIQSIEKVLEDHKDNEEFMSIPLEKKLFRLKQMNLQIIQGGYGGTQWN